MIWEPQEIGDVELAFPAHALRLMPPHEAIPAEFKDDANTWVRFQLDWFYRGLPGETQIEPREGVDGRRALRHLKAIQGSFEPKHEHKMAAVAYLASLWFHRVITPDKTYGEGPHDH